MNRLIIHKQMMILMKSDLLTFSVSSGVVFEEIVSTRLPPLNVCLCIICLFTDCKKEIYFQNLHTFYIVLIKLAFFLTFCVF